MKLYLRHVLIAVLCAASVSAWAQPQPPDTLWTRTFGGSMLDEFHDVKCTPDGGYVAVGETWSFGAGDVDWYVVKTDSLGNPEWSQTFGGIYDDRARAVVITDEGDFVVAGHISGDTSRYGDFALIKLNSEGDSLWGHLYGGRGHEEARAAVSTADGGFVLQGFTTSGAGGYDFLVLKVDSNGDSVWSRTYGGRGWDQGFAIQQTADGGFALSGSTASRGAGAYDMWLIKTDAQGDSLWSRTYGGTGFDECRDMQITSDGGYILVGYTGSFGQGWENAWLVKTDSLGNMQWNHAYGNVEQVYALSTRQLPDGGFVVSGWYLYDVEDARAWLLRTDASGDSLWSRQWGVPNLISSANSLALTEDGGCILAGLQNYQSNTNTSGDGWLLKTERIPLSVPDRPSVLPQQISLGAYPNPFNSQATITFTLSRLGNIKLTLVDILGRQIVTLTEGRQDAGTHILSLSSMSLVSSGLFFIRLEAGAQVSTLKLVHLK